MSILVSDGECLVLSPMVPTELASNPYLTRFYHWTMNPIYMFTMCVAYLGAVISFSTFHKSPLADRKNSDKPHKSPLDDAKKSNGSDRGVLKAFIFAHNVLLSIFSAYICWQAGRLLIESYKTRHFWEALNGQAINAGIHFYAWLYYLSKYWEFLDTAILLAKGRPTTLLQTYHHLGIVWVSWLSAFLGVGGSWILIAFNTAIHTVMYAYYGVTSVGVKPAWKHLLTYAQMAQFVLGNAMCFIPLSAYRNMKDNPCPLVDVYGLMSIRYHWWYYATGWITMAFSGSMFVLFWRFARKQYWHKT